MSCDVTEPDQGIIIQASPSLKWYSPQMKRLEEGQVSDITSLKPAALNWAVLFVHFCNNLTNACHMESGHNIFPLTSL